MDDIRELRVVGTAPARSTFATPRSINVRVALPRKADLTKVAANLDAGILEISFPKLSFEGRQLEVRESRLYPSAESEHGFVKI